jgi:glycine/D-amino acid oxidase-like deaminating enzyme
MGNDFWNRGGGRRRDTAGARHVASHSLWLDQCHHDGDALTARAPLPGDATVDVAIVGGGLTGLWTARELLRRDPTIRVAVIEASVCGYGASGRNGGWASALFAGDRTALAATHGRGAVRRLLHTMAESVDVVGASAAEDGVDCGFDKAGTLAFATTPAHVQLARRRRSPRPCRRPRDPGCAVHT